MLLPALLHHVHCNLERTRERRRSSDRGLLEPDACARRSGGTFRRPRTPATRSESSYHHLSGCSLPGSRRKRTQQQAHARGAVQLAAAAFSRAAAAAAASAHHTLAPDQQSRGWHYDNAFAVVPPTVQPRSSFFADEQPAPQPTEQPYYAAPARPVPFSHVTCAPPPSLPQLSPCLPPGGTGKRRDYCADAMPASIVSTVAVKEP
jgi:hypothetical protein